jgi:hypothetical protein
VDTATAYDLRVTAIEELTDDEHEWIQANLAAIAVAGVDVHDPESLGRFNDMKYAEWVATGRKSDPNPTINMIGIGLGECLNQLIGTAWVVANEASGGELAIHRAASNVLMYPPNAVGKRWSDQEPGFIPGFVGAIVERIQQLDAA